MPNSDSNNHPDIKNIMDKTFDSALTYSVTAVILSWIATPIVLWLNFYSISLTKVIVFNILLPFWMFFFIVYFKTIRIQPSLITIYNNFVRWETELGEKEKNDNAEQS